MINVISNKNIDAVIGTRFSSEKSIKNIPFLKRFTLRIAKLYERLFFQIKLSDAHNGLRVLSRKVVKECLLPIENYDMSHATEISYKLCHSKFNLTEFPVNIKYHDIKSQSVLNSINIVFRNIFFSLK